MFDDLILFLVKLFFFLESLIASSSYLFSFLGLSRQIFQHILLALENASQYNFPQRSCSVSFLLCFLETSLVHPLQLPGCSLRLLHSDCPDASLCNSASVDPHFPGFFSSSFLKYSLILVWHIFH